MLLFFLSPFFFRGTKKRTRQASTRHAHRKGLEDTNGRIHAKEIRARGHAGVSGRRGAPQRRQQAQHRGHYLLLKTEKCLKELVPSPSRWFFLPPPPSLCGSSKESTLQGIKKLLFIFYRVILSVSLSSNPFSTFYMLPLQKDPRE